MSPPIDVDGEGEGQLGDAAAEQRKGKPDWREHWGETGTGRAICQPPPYLWRKVGGVSLLPLLYLNPLRGEVKPPQPQHPDLVLLKGEREIKGEVCWRPPVGGIHGIRGRNADGGA